MSKQYPGGLITKTPVTPAGPYQDGSAPGIWTLNQAAYWAKQGLWPTAGNVPTDPYFENVTMLLHGDGSASGTTSVLPFNSDASTNNFNLTINGDARSNNFNPYQAGYYSNSFNGSSYFTTSASQVVPTGSFTVECWVYVTSTSNQAFVAQGTSGNAGRFSLCIEGGLWFAQIGSASINTGTPVANTWNYLAVTFNGSTLTLYVNGTSIGTASTGTSAQNTTLAIGTLGASWATSGYFVTGYISNVRVSNNVRTITTPTAPYTSDANTMLLACQSNRFIDSSSNAYVLNISAGSPAASPAQPFTLPSSVATYGSGYFDGTGDSLTINGGTGVSAAADFTYEVWIYPTTVSPTYQQIAHGTSLNGAYGFQLLLNGSALYLWNSLSHQTAVLPNQWSHVALVRSSNTVRLYLNGVQSTNSITTSSTATIITIGTNGSGGTETFNGYQSNGRLVSGTAIYTATFTPPTSPLTAVSGTSLLTQQYNGAGNNNGFKDSGQFNFPITRNGNTTQGTFTPYGSNWSNYFNGSSAIVNRSNNTALAMGTGDFTIEFWMNAPSTGAKVIYDTRLSTSSGAGGFDIYIDTGVIYAYGGSSTNVSLVSGSYTANQWNHIAVVRSGSSTGNVKLYINGTLSSTYGSADTSNYSLGYLAIGAFYNPSLDYFYTGYLSNLRVVKGTAVYTSSFTPSTTPLTAITNTSLLTCQSNRFIDNSTNAFALTTSGSPSVQRFSPFSPTTAYSTSVIGGSGYFDGTTDYLTASANAAFGFGTGDFTMECWVYPVSWVGSFDGFISTLNSVSAIGAHLSRDGVEVNGVATAWGTTLQLSQWTHLALTRSGTSLRLFVNGAVTNTATNSANIGSSSAFAAGRRLEDVSNYYCNAYISNARIVKGTAVYTAAFTPSTAPLTAISGTSILLNATNAGILDNAMMNDLETVGNAQISTSVKKYGTGSMYFDGTGDGLQAVGTPNTVFGTGDFTVEFWIYLNANTGTFKKFIELGTTGSCFTIETQSTTNVLTITDLNNTVFVTSSSALNLTTWTHVAATRSGTTLRLFQNGTQVGSATNSTNFANSGSVYIGQSNSGQAINAYMDDIRVTKGVARYTASFTPPTSAFPNQ